MSVLQVGHGGWPLRYDVWTVPSIDREYAVEFGWKRHWLDLDFNVVDLVQAESGDIWAVAQFQLRGETASAILRRRLAEWECVVALESG